MKEKFNRPMINGFRVDPVIKEIMLADVKNGFAKSGNHWCEMAANIFAKMRDKEKMERFQLEKAEAIANGKSNSKLVSFPRRGLVRNRGLGKNEV